MRFETSEIRDDSWLSRFPTEPFFTVCFSPLSSDILCLYSSLVSERRSMIVQVYSSSSSIIHLRYVREKPFNPNIAIIQNCLTVYNFQLCLMPWFHFFFAGISARTIFNFAVSLQARYLFYRQCGWSRCSGLGCCCPPTSSGIHVSLSPIFSPFNIF